MDFVFGPWIHIGSENLPADCAIFTWLKTSHYLFPGLLKIKCSFSMSPWSFYIRHPQNLSFQQKQYLAYELILQVHLYHWLTIAYSVPMKMIRLKGTPRPSEKLWGGVSTTEPPSRDRNTWIFSLVCFKSGNMELKCFFPLSFFLFLMILCLRDSR